MKNTALFLPVVVLLWLVLSNRASGTSLTLTITNLPPSGRTADGQVVAFAGTLNAWNNSSTVATVTQGRLTYIFPDIGSPSALGSDWGDLPANANAGFQFVVPGTWDSVIKTDIISNDGNFRIALAEGMANMVEIDAGLVPTLVDQASAVRVNGVVGNPVPVIDRSRFAFPGGRWKALVMSYDDGHVQDRGVVPIFNEHGIKGTFHLNSSALNQDTFISGSEIAALFAGHEVSSHTVDHPYLDQLGDDSIQWEIETDRNTLTGYAGYGIQSLSYPFGAYNNRVLAKAAALGVKCSRTTKDTYNLNYLPPNPLKWHPTCHHSAAQSMAEELVARTSEEMALLFIWGHSYELDYNLSNNSWAYLSSLCGILGDRGDIWYATMTEVSDYLAAIRALAYPTSNCVYNPSGSVTIWAKLAGRLCRIQPGKKMTYPAGQVSASPEDLQEGATATICYAPASNFLSQAASLYAHVGHDGWKDVRDVVMTKADDSTWSCAYPISNGAQKINFAFTDGLGTWDDNGGFDWSLAVKASVVETPACVQLMTGSPGVSERPASGQNNMGDTVDICPLGGFLATSNQGGFGSFGSVYVGGDASNLYLGAIGCDMAGSNNAMILFLAVDTLPDGAANLWNQRGTPFGLDRLHNLGLAPAANVAIVIGDEFGDGTFSHFNLGSGYDFGQGVFYLSSNSVSFLPVPGARLSQFDGSGTNLTTSSDDDGNRLTERWEVSIPWSGLNAACGFRSLGSLHVSGVIVSDGTSGNDRYLSANYLGSSAAGVIDGNGNYGFNFVNLVGHRIGLPFEDSDLDGMSDLHEFMAGTDAADASSLLKIAQPGGQNDARVLRFDSVPGKQYQIQYKEDLMSGSPWLDLAGPLTATGNVCSATNLVENNPRMFYRIRLNRP